jgi:hypothetical protein
MRRCVDEFSFIQACYAAAMLWHCRSIAEALPWQCQLTKQHMQKIATADLRQ